VSPTLGLDGAVEVQVIVWATLFIVNVVEAEEVPPGVVIVNVLLDVSAGVTNVKVVSSTTVNEAAGVELYKVTAVAPVKAVPVTVIVTLPSEVALDGVNEVITGGAT
jgi:hypothetical protein